MRKLRIPSKTKRRPQGSKEQNEYEGKINNQHALHSPLFEVELLYPLGKTYGEGEGRR